MGGISSEIAKLRARIGGALDNRAVEVLVHEELETYLREERETVLWVGARYDYGNRDWGLSYEHYTFFHTLLHMGYSLVYFDYDRLLQKFGKRKMSELLRKISLNISAALKGDAVQIKGRDFEAPGCGCALLTEASAQIQDYYVPGEEIITYTDADDAVRKAHYYLAHEEELKRVAEKGYQRVLAEHTMEKRIKDIIALIDN